MESLRKKKIGGGVEEVDEAGEEEGGVEGGEEEDGGGGEGGRADDQVEKEGGQEQQQLGQGFPGNAGTCKSKISSEGLRKVAVDEGCNDMEENFRSQNSAAISGCIEDQFFYA